MGLQQQRVLRLAFVAQRAFQHGDRRFEPVQRGSRRPPWRRRPPAGAPASPARFRRAPNRTPPSGSGAPAARPACRSDRALPAPAAPSRAPCHSRDSRTLRPPSAAGREPGGGMADSSSRSRRASSGFLSHGDEGVAVVSRVAVDLGLAVLDAKDHVGVEADHRIAAARGAALHRFEQEDVARAAARQLHEGRNRGFQIGDQPQADQRRLAGIVKRGEGVEFGLEHRRRSHCSEPRAARSDGLVDLARPVASASPRYIALSTSSAMAAVETAAERRRLPGDFRSSGGVVASVTLKTYAPALVGEGDAGGADRRCRKSGSRRLRSGPAPPERLSPCACWGWSAIGGGEFGELLRRSRSSAPAHWPWRPDRFCVGALLQGLDRPPP